MVFFFGGGALLGWMGGEGEGRGEFERVGVWLHG